MKKLFVMLVCFISFAIFFTMVNAFADNQSAFKFNGYEIIDAIPNQPQDMAETATATSATKPVYRFSTATGFFYTIDENEKNTIIQYLPGYRFDGIAFYAFNTPDTTSAVPTPGTWNGSIVSFNVSSASNSLTPTGSSLAVGTVTGVSLAIKFGGSSCVPVIVYYTSDIPITNNSFSKSYTFSDGSSFSVSGTFTGSNSASGVAVYKDVSPYCSGSYTWSTTK